MPINETLEACQAAGWAAYSKALQSGQETREAVAAYIAAFEAAKAELMAA